MNKIILLPIICFSWLGCSSHTQQPWPILPPEDVNIREPPPVKKQGLELVSAKWHKDGFGAVAVWKLVIKNNSAKTLGDIKYRTQYFSETGNLQKKDAEPDRMIEKIVAPGQKRTFEINDGFVSEEAVRGVFEITEWREIP